MTSDDYTNSEHRYKYSWRDPIATEAEIASMTEQRDTDENDRSEQRGEAFAAFAMSRINELDWEYDEDTAERVAAAAGRRGNGDDTVKVYCGRYDLVEEAGSRTWTPPEVEVEDVIPDEAGEFQRRIEAAVIERFAHAGAFEGEVPRKELIPTVAALAMGSAIAQFRMTTWSQEQVEDEVINVLDYYVY